MVRVLEGFFLEASYLGRQQLLSREAFNSAPEDCICYVVAVLNSPNAPMNCENDIALII